MSNEEGSNIERFRLIWDTLGESMMYKYNDSIVSILRSLCYHNSWLKCFLSVSLTVGDRIIISINTFEISVTVVGFLDGVLAESSILLIPKIVTFSWSY